MRGIILFILGLILVPSAMTEAQAPDEVAAFLTGDGLVIWNPGTGERSAPLPESRHSLSFGWSPDGRYLAYASANPLDPSDASVVLYDTASGATLIIAADLPDLQAGEFRDFWLPDASAYFYIVPDGLYAVDLPAVTPVAILEGPVQAGPQSPGGRYLPIQWQDQAFVFDLTERTFEPLRADIVERLWGAEGDLIYLVHDEAQENFTVFRWSGGVEEALFEIEGGRVSGMRWNGDRLGMIHDQGDNVVRYLEWDGSTLSEQPEPPLYSPDREYAVTSWAAGGLDLWQAATGEWQRLSDALPSSLAWSADSTRLAYTTRELILIHDVVSSRNQVYAAPCLPDSCPFVIDGYECGTWSPRGRWLICTAGDYSALDRLALLIDTAEHTITALPDVVLLYSAGPVAWRP